jgi:hypothetical protein
VIAAVVVPIGIIFLNYFSLKKFIMDERTERAIHKLGKGRKNIGFFKRSRE